jgi:hypothetical protein
MGVKHCSNNTILILSAHSQITISPNLSIINSYLNDYVAVFGKQIPIYKGKKITPRYIWSHFTESNEVNMFSTIENRPFLHNAFCFYSKSTLEKYPFDETLPGKEDRYWATDVIKKGFNYLYTPELEVNHYWTPNGATWKGIG